MQHYSRVAAIIGGNDTTVMRFFDELVQNNLLDESGILDKFQLTRFENDFMLFGKFFNFVLWSKPIQATWNMLKEHACRTELGYVFYRLEQTNNYIEYEDNSSASYFDRRLFDLYQFDLQRIHPRLESLAMN